MSKPVLLTVDDDPEVLNAVERDLRAHYRSDYRVVKAPSGAQALDAVRQLKQRGAQIALFLVNERMTGAYNNRFENVKFYDPRPSYYPAWWWVPETAQKYTQGAGKATASR